MTNKQEDFIINKEGSSNNSVFFDKDVFADDFDRTWMNLLPLDNYEMESTLYFSENIDSDDKTIFYKFNTDGFRSDNFTGIHNGLHILFAGCSQTEGVGGNLETVWTKMLHNEIENKNLLSGFFSIARSGFGWQKIISNFLVYTKKYGYPEYLFILLPNIGRFWDWNMHKEKWFYVHRYPNSQGLSIDHNDLDFFAKKPLTVLEHRKLFIDFVAGWKLFERLCLEKNIKFLWASWDFMENENYLNANFSSNYIHLNNKEFMSFIKSLRPDGKIKQHDLERRDGHNGILFHEYWKHKFLEKIKENGWLNV